MVSRASGSPFYAKCWILKESYVRESRCKKKNIDGKIT